MVRVHCDPPGRKPEWGPGKDESPERVLRKQRDPQRGETRKGRTSEAENRRTKVQKKKASKKGKERKDKSPEGKAPEQETEERKFQRGKLPKEELARKGKVLPEAEAARRKPPRCEKALKEMEISERGAPIGAKAPSTLTTAQ